jgi:uncharacterized protein YpuA (DUF1002 family)
MKKIFSILTLTTLLLTFSCSDSNNNSTSKTPTAYEMMEVAFENYPSKNDIQPMMESVMTRYELEINENNLQKVASMLVSLRKASKVGVTEMELLKHMYQNGSDKISLPDQAGLSATILETTK